MEDMEKLVERGIQVYEWLKTQEYPKVENLWPEDARALVASILDVDSYDDIIEADLLLAFVQVVPGNKFKYYKVLKNGFENVDIMSDWWSFRMDADIIEKYAEHLGFSSETADLIKSRTSNLIEDAFIALSEDEAKNFYRIEVNKAKCMIEGLINMPGFSEIANS